YSGRPHGKFCQGFVLGLIHRAIFRGNRSAVWIDFRFPDRRGHAVYELVRRGVLESFRLLVHAIPLIPERLGEIGFDDAMTPKRTECREATAFGELQSV